MRQVVMLDRCSVSGEMRSVCDALVTQWIEPKGNEERSGR
jgi:hypothetical protein